VDDIKLKVAEVSDAEDIMNIHFSAVHETAASYYPGMIIQNWASPKTPERLKQFIDAIQGSDEIFVVAKINDRTVGFGSIMPKRNELRAVYVHPSFGRQGIGTQILADLERLAVEQGIKVLDMDTSLNAERFYLKNGYVAIESGFHKLRSGHKMPCVKMRKILITAPCPKPRHHSVDGKV